MNPERMKYYTSSGVEDKQFGWLYDGLEQLIPLTNDYVAVGCYDMRNLRSLVEVDYSWYKVLLSGELDWGIDWQMLFDCKSAKKKRIEAEKWELECYQARFYSWFQFLQHPELEEIPFTYLVFTKQKTIQKQEITHIIKRDEAEDFVKEKLYQYLLWIHKWDIQTTEWSLERM